MVIVSVAMSNDINILLSIFNTIYLAVLYNKYIIISMYIEHYRLGIIDMHAVLIFK